MVEHIEVHYVTRRAAIMLFSFMLRAARRSIRTFFFSLSLGQGFAAVSALSDQSSPSCLIFFSQHFLVAPGAGFFFTF